MAANPVIVGCLKPFLGGKSKVKNIRIISLELFLYKVSKQQTISEVFSILTREPYFNNDVRF